MPYAKGDRVRIIVPENGRLNGTLATVASTYAGGECLDLDAPAAASGKFRAHVTEVRPDVAPRSAAMGYTGSLCSVCGGVRVRRAGACEVCDDCGTNSGCG